MRVRAIRKTRKIRMTRKPRITFHCGEDSIAARKARSNKLRETTTASNRLNLGSVFVEIILCWAPGWGRRFDPQGARRRPERGSFGTSPRNGRPGLGFGPTLVPPPLVCVCVWKSRGSLWHESSARTETATSSNAGADAPLCRERSGLQSPPFLPHSPLPAGRQESSWKRPARALPHAKRRRPVPHKRRAHVLVVGLLLLFRPDAQQPGNHSRRMHGGAPALACRWCGRKSVALRQCCWRTCGALNTIEEF